MSYKKDYVQIKAFTEQIKNRYGFRGLLHFTDFSNLHKIFNEGYLYSRGECDNKQIKFKDGANHSVLDKAQDYVHKCVRFYYRGSTPTLYQNEGIKLLKYCESIHVPIPVFLLFDEELLYLDYTVFTDGNATNSNRGNNYDFFRNMDWNTIFHNTWFYPDERDYIVNKRQAELLSEKPISLKYLKKIIFRCEADKKRAINIFGKDERYEVDIKLFSKKNTNIPKYEEEENNFIYDYDIDYEYVNNKKDAVTLSMKFQKQWTDYFKTYSIIDIYGNDVYNIEVEEYYKDCFGNISKNNNNGFADIELIFRGNVDEWSKIEIYMNNVLCIEEVLLKDMINKFKVYSQADNYSYISIEFSNINFKKHKHRYEILNTENQVIKESKIQYKKELNGLSWRINIGKYMETWSKINYYIDDYLCSSENIL